MRLEMVKSDAQVIGDLIVSLVAFAGVYYALNPTAAQGVNDWCQRQMGKLAHRLSVWATKRAIKDLPETSER